MKSVLITGGTSGIGLAAAEIFLQNGYQAVLMGRSKERGEAAVQVLQKKYGDIVSFRQADVSHAADCERVVHETVARCGTLDVLINSAGIYFEKAIEDVTEEDFDMMLGINIKGLTFMTKYAVLAMKKQGHGNIVNVSSDAGLHGNMLCSTYCSSKGAVNMFTKAMALELGPYGIRINAVCPGDVMTPLTENQLAIYPDKEEALREMAGVYPLGRIAAPEEIATVIYFLTTDGAGFVNGALWSVDGGLTS